MSQPDSLGVDSETRQFLDSYVTGDVDWGRSPSATQQRAIGLQLHGCGHYREAEFCLRAAHSQALAQRDENLAAAIRLDIGRTLIQVSPGKAIVLLTRLRTENSRQLNQVCLHAALGSVLMEFCQFKGAEQSFLAAEEAAKEAPNTVFSTYSEANRARNAFQLGNSALADRLNCRSAKKLQEFGEYGNSGLVIVNRAIHCMLLGLLDSAWAFCEESRGLQARANNPRLGAVMAITSAELEIIAGDTGRAREMFTDLDRGPNIPPAILARTTVLKAVLEEQQAPNDLLANIEAVARDLHARDLREDSALIYLIAASYAEREGLSGERYFSTARSIFGDEPGLRYLADHYRRILAALRGVRHPRLDQPIPAFLTQAPEVIEIKDRLSRLAKTDVRLLIEGESGTGKSFLARQIHEQGDRRGGPFIAVDCTNLDENLFESKLFGHVRGSFTGAVADAVGLVEQAHKGTLFLDEIGELPARIQAKLLYTIEEQRYRPVGARVEKQADFRVIAATNQDIDAMLEEGTLRRDLFFRIAGYRVHLPPLRHRREDIVPLIEHRLELLNLKYGRRKILRSGVWETLVLYDWPGNVRELNAALERGFHLAVGRYVDLDDLGLGLGGTAAYADLSWYQVRRAHLLRVLRLCRGNVTKAARLLGLNRTTLIYKLKLLDIERRDFDPGPVGGEVEEESTRWVADRKEQGSGNEDPAAGEALGPEEGPA